MYWERRRTPWLGLAWFGSERIGALGTSWLTGKQTHGGVQRARAAFSSSGEGGEGGREGGGGLLMPPSSSSPSFSSLLLPFPKRLPSSSSSLHPSLSLKLPSTFMPFKASTLLFLKLFVLLPVFQRHFLFLLTFFSTSQDF